MPPLFVPLVCALLAGNSHAQVEPTLPGEVESLRKIGQFQGGFFGDIVADDGFGNALAALGDVDGDGIGDLAVGTPFADIGGPWRGGVWILFLEADGSVRAWQRLSALDGELPVPPLDFDRFGWSLAPLGDYDGDGVPDLAVGASGRADGGPDRGAVHLLMLRPDGTVHTQHTISSTSGGFGGTLLDGDGFGSALANLGDLDGDGELDLAVSARLDDDGGLSAGAFWMLFLDGAGGVLHEQKVGPLDGGLQAEIDPLDFFASSLAAIGDVNGDGLVDLVAGAPNDSDDGLAHGAVYVLLMAADGTVQRTQKINHLVGGLDTQLDAIDTFGTAVAGVGDVNADGVPDLAVSAPFDDDFAPGTEFEGSARGAVYLLFLERDGSVGSRHKISDSAAQFEGQLLGVSGFGSGLAALGDVDGDGTPDLAAGMSAEPGFGGQPKPAVWRVTLHGATWTDLGGGFGAAPGALAPTLTGLGSLVPGEPLQIAWRGRVPHAPLVLVSGLSFLGVPLAGGVLGPAPQQLVFTQSDASGARVVSARWPGDATPGVSLYLQAWELDRGGVVAASGTLRAEAP
ncbi:MAG: hypothetical protein DHS20C15_05400 [Planctomycetota bacterium]|nr:MAG: hypothetical protein DHS20C15_05400 [Planctomycetota bacterium]